MSKVSDSSLNELSPEEKRAALAKLLRERASRESKIHSQSYGQRSLWFMYQLDPSSTAYNIMYAARLRSDVDQESLTRSFQKIFDRHAALRTTYETRGGRPIQVIHAYHEFKLETVDARDWEWADLEQRIQDESNQPFDLEKGPVVRIKLFERADNEESILLLVSHHIALDFWALDLLFDELELTYRGEASGKPVSMPPAKIEYTDFVDWQESQLSGPVGAKMWDYWENQLGGDLPGLNLPTDHPRPPMQSFNGESYRFTLSTELSERLKALAKTESATLFATMMAAFQTLLYRYSGQQDILVGSPTAGRNRAEWEELLGYFLNPIVLRAQLAPSMTFKELLAQVRDTVLQGIAQQDFPFPLLVEKLSPPRDASRAPIFQVAFGWDKPRRTPEPNGADGAGKSVAHSTDGLDLQPFMLGQQGSAFDLMLMMLDQGDQLSAALQYNTDLFDESTIVRFVNHFRMLLESIATDPNQQLADLGLLSHTEARQQLAEWNETEASYPRDKCLHELFEAQARRTPDAVAVACDGAQYTYQELSVRTNQLANHLRGLGVRTNTLVGVYVDRSPEMLVSILGVLKAGGAYVPLSTGTPSERMAYMLEESAAPIVITESNLRDTLPAFDGQLVVIDQLSSELAKQSDSPLERITGPSDLAYVIFTSGSTGRPKGVQIEHRTVVNFLNSMAREPGITERDTLLAVTTLTFDISVLELFLPLTVGAKVEIVTYEVAMDGRQLADALTSSKSTIVQATPATWRMLIDAGWQGDSSLKVLCGGEAMPRDLAEQLIPKCRSLWNMYGPTETTIWSAVDRVREGEGPVLIGRPIDNTRLYVLDARMNPVPIGVPGDLYVGGDGLARGYLNQPELTAERFVNDPFADKENARMYATGDVASFHADGNLEFLGRSDNQVKVSGFRIELGEIESVLSQHSKVRESVVVARQVGSSIDDKQLVAYVIAEGSEPSVSELREFLGQKLPAYMLPRAFVMMDEFPLNAARKVDRNALPEVDSARPNLQANYVPPRDREEEVLVDVWASVMGLDQVGIHDNFFELGGASIQSLEIAALAEAEGVPCTPALLFQFPTIAELAQASRNSASTSESSTTESATDESETDTVEPEALPPVAPTPTTAAELDSYQLQCAETAEEALKTQANKANLLIESLGVYLPPNEVTSKQVLEGCKNRVWFPLEGMTGIKTRRMAGETEFSTELAIKAIDECLAQSKYGVDDIDLVISCGITRFARLITVTVEPNISVLLKQHFGFENAMVFDITNACTGMFTAMKIVDAFITNGMIRRGLVVSGEYITDITRTAQLEISEFLDPRLACLTVGDAGAAMVLEAAPSNDVGFHELDMYSLSSYSDLCIGRLTEQPHGGAIMHVPDPMKHTSVAVKHSVAHAKFLLEKAKWPKEKMQHLIMHQTSRRSLRDGKRAINKAFKAKICNDKNTIDNLAHRGNTATTSHMVAVWDTIKEGRINSNDNVVFGITGSGQTIGTGIYTFDNLPDRIRANENGAAKSPGSTVEVSNEEPLTPTTRRVQISSIGLVSPDDGIECETIALSTAAAERCLANSNYDVSDIELMIFAGVSRTGYICEPAIATMIAGELGMNGTIESELDKKTFAFDVYNAGVSLFNACQVATEMIQSGQFRNAMIVVSEVETNKEHFPETPTGAAEAASAIILDSSDGKAGFGNFVIEYNLEHLDARKLEGWYQDGRPYLDFQEVPNINDLYLDNVPAAVERVLAEAQLDLTEIKFILPPQISSEFNDRLSKLLGVPRDKVIDVSTSENLFTSSLPFSLAAACETGQIAPGDVGLIINVASGIQVGAATYHFPPQAPLERS